MQTETIKKHIEDLNKIRDSFIHKATKINEFKTKLDVKLDGDSIKGTYSIRVSNHSKNHNTIDRAIIDKLVTDYELSIDNEIDIMTSTINLLSCIGARDFCEVDLFDMTKPPVEC